MAVGFMQGRLCDPVNGRIQAFPWDQWETEFPVAARLSIELMEWTLDQDRLYDNPLMTGPGRERIRKLSTRHGVQVPSLTGDCFMQAPFYKASGGRRDALLADLNAVIDSCAELRVRYVVVPLVDNGRIESAAEEKSLLSGLLPLSPTLAANDMRIVFESDFPPMGLAEFINRFPRDTFGINYDIGNSAALGYDPVGEIAAYGARIGNVHVKDRLLHGTTVPLGQGSADFPAVFAALQRAGYTGNFILQTARAHDNDHAGAIARYRDVTQEWLESCGF